MGTIGIQAQMESRRCDSRDVRGTGFPKMFRKMENNGSLQPIIETDEESTYFMVTLPINQEYVEAVNDKDSDIVGDKASDKDNNIIINSLDDIIVISNQVYDIADDIADDKVKTILKDHLHGIVEEILNTANKWIKTEELFATVYSLNCF